MMLVWVLLMVYGMFVLGNCYKVCMLFEYFGSCYEWVEVDSVNGQIYMFGFLVFNFNVKVLLVQCDDGWVLFEFNVILFWLVEGMWYLFIDGWECVQMLCWMFFEQYSYEFCVVVVCFICGWIVIDFLCCVELLQLQVCVV